jgi:hypothetical protein
VTGGRRWYAPDLAEQVGNCFLARYGPGLVIVHGGGTGIDAAFVQACDKLGIQHEPHPARWKDLKAPRR